MYGRQMRRQSTSLQQKKMRAQKALRELQQGKTINVRQKKFVLRNGRIIDLNSGMFFTQSEFIQEFM